MSPSGSILAPLLVSTSSTLGLPTGASMSKLTGLADSAATAFLTASSASYFAHQSFPKTTHALVPMKNQMPMVANLCLNGRPGAPPLPKRVNAAMVKSPTPDRTLLHHHSPVRNPTMRMRAVHSAPSQRAFSYFLHQHVNADQPVGSVDGTAPATAPRVAGVALLVDIALPTMARTMIATTIAVVVVME